MNQAEVKERVVKDTAKYSFAQYSSQGIGLVIAVAMRRFLGPYYMGIWSLLNVCRSYLDYLSLGVNSAAVYKIPFYRGKQDKASEEEVRDTSFSFLLLGSVFSSLCLMAAAVLLRDKYPMEVVVGLLALAIFIILERLYSFYILILRAYSNFSVLSKSLIFDAVVNLGLILLLVRGFKLYGLYVVIAVLAVLNTLFVHKLAGYRINFRFRFKGLKALILYGFPILVNGFLSTILRTVDRIMIVKMLGVTFVGYYSIAIMAKRYVYGLSNNLYIVTIPYMQKLYGRQERIEDIKKFVTVSAHAISYILAPLLGIIYLVSPLFIQKLLPRFTAGILPLQILLLDMFFSACCSQGSQFLVTLGKQARLVPISMAAIGLNIFLNYYFITRGWGISGVALGTSLASFFSFIMILGYAMKHFAKPREIARFIFKILFPLLYITGIVLAGSHFISISNPYLRLGVNLFILFVASLPLLFYIDKKTQILHLIFGFFKRKGLS